MEGRIPKPTYVNLPLCLGVQRLKPQGGLGKRLPLGVDWKQF